MKFKCRVDDTRGCAKPALPRLIRMCARLDVTCVAPTPQPDIRLNSSSERVQACGANRIHRSAAIQGLICKSALAVKTRAMLNSITPNLCFLLSSTSSNKDSRSDVYCYWDSPPAQRLLAGSSPRHLADRPSHYSRKVPGTGHYWLRLPPAPGFVTGSVGAGIDMEPNH